MNEVVQRSDEEREFYFREGCYVLEMLNDPSHPELSIARARVKGGGTTRPHRLRDTWERYVIQCGAGRVFLGGDDEGVPVGPGDVVLIAPGQTQSIRNEGEEDLVFLALCTPRFRPENYEEA